MLHFIRGTSQQFLQIVICMLDILGVQHSSPRTKRANKRRRPIMDLLGALTSAPTQTMNLHRTCPLLSSPLPMRIFWGRSSFAGAGAGKWSGWGDLLSWVLPWMDLWVCAVGLFILKFQFHENISFGVRRFNCDNYFLVCTLSDCYELDWYWLDNQ